MVKNRLALRALKAEFPETLKRAFRKPTAIAYTAADPVLLAKALRDFAVQNKVLVMKGGMFKGQYVPAERFDEITKLLPPGPPGKIGATDGRPPETDS